MKDIHKDDDFGDLLRACPGKMRTGDVILAFKTATDSLRSVQGWVHSHDDPVLSKEYGELVHRLAVVVGLSMLSDIQEDMDDGGDSE